MLRTLFTWALRLSSSMIFFGKKKTKKNLKQNLNQGNNVEEIKALGKIKTVKLANKYVAYF